MKTGNFITGRPIILAAVALIVAAAAALIALPAAAETVEEVRLTPTEREAEYQKLKDEFGPPSRGFCWNPAWEELAQMVVLSRYFKITGYLKEMYWNDRDEFDRVTEGPLRGGTDAYKATL